mmetsp:Transcript_1068/g.2436  ORF Transcript_1068/g.2436 Transcript_1068/m.2436 type:complete len:299 (+) Transcript_1068:1004-1900(+)
MYRSIQEWRHPSIVRYIVCGRERRVLIAPVAIEEVEPFDEVLEDVEVQDEVEVQEEDSFSVEIRRVVVVVVVVVIVESCASKVSFPNVPRQAFVDVVSAETRISGGGRDSKPNAVVVVVGARTVQNGDGDVRGPSSHVEHQHPLFVRRVFLARRVRRRRRRREQSVRHGRRGRFGHDADVAFEAGAAGRQAEGASLGLGVVRRDSDDGVSYSYSYSRRGSGGGRRRRGGAGDANAVSAHAGGGEEVVVGGDAEGAEQDGGGLQGGDQDGVVVVVVFGMTLTCDSRRGRRFVGRCERVV